MAGPVQQFFWLHLEIFNFGNFWTPKKASLNTHLHQKQRVAEPSGGCQPLLPPNGLMAILKVKSDDIYVVDNAM